MMMIKPKRIQPNTGAIIPVNVLDTSKSSLDDLFHWFVDFIDATPSTVRTYRASQRQWAKYMRANNIPRYVDTYIPPKLISVSELENKIVKIDQQLSTLEADSRLIMMKYQ